VAEAAILLQTLLPPGAPLPGGLRYALARALHEVDAPPFDSLQDFSATLSRYERGDRTAAVRRLVRRAAAQGGPAATRADGERRRRSQAVVDVRRHLRAADRALYEQRLSAPWFVAPARSPASTLSRTGLAVAVVAAMLIGAVALLVPFSGSPAPPSAPLPVSTSASLQRDIPLPSERALPGPPRKRGATVRAREGRRPAAHAPARARGWSIFPRIKLVDNFPPGRH
jgi:hypothetical protein